MLVFLFSLLLVSSSETQFIDDIAYVNTSYGMIAQQPFIIDSNTEANIMFENRAGITSFIACIRLDTGLSIDKVEIVSAKRKIWWWFDEDLREVHRINDKIKCIKSFDNEEYIDLSLKLRYNGHGILKYDLFAYPTSYGYTISGILDAIDAGHIIILDPYLIGSLNSTPRLLIYLPFDNNINDVSPSFTETIENDTQVDSTVGSGAEIVRITNVTSLTNNNLVINYSAFYYYATSFEYNVLLEFEYDDGTKANTSTLHVGEPINSWRELTFNNSQPFKLVESINTYMIVTGADYNETNVTINLEKKNSNASYYINGTAGYDFRFNQNSIDIFNNYDGDAETDIVYSSEGIYCNGSSRLAIDDLDTPFWNTSATFTWSAWIKPDSQQGVGSSICANFIGTSNSVWESMCIVNNKSLGVRLNDDTGNKVATDTTVDINDSEWHHVAVNVDYGRTGDEIQLWLDGANNVNTTTAGTFFFYKDAQFDLCSNQGGEATYTYNGYIRNIALYNKSLTYNEMVSLGNEGTFTENILGESNSVINLKGDEYISLENNSFPTGNNPISISMWINASKVTGTQRLISLSNKKTQFSSIYLANNILNANFFAVSLSYTGISINEWTHIVFTHDGTTGNLYLDGDLKDTDTNVGNKYTAEIYLGRMVNNTLGYGDQFFNGSIDEFMVYNYVLSESDISELYNGFNKTINNCSYGGEEILNFDLYDETSLNQANGVIEYSILSYDPILEEYYLINNTIYGNSTSICYTSENYDKLIINATIKYNISGGVVEYYYLRNFNLSDLSLPQQIGLYGLQSSLSTSFLITYQDEHYLYISDVVVDLQRKYVGEGNQFYSVEHGLTDDGGQTRLHLVTEDIVYRFIVRSSNNSILYTSGEYFALCQATPCQINIQKPNDETEEESITGNLQYSITNDSVFEATGIITFEFLTTDSSITNISMNVTNTVENESLCFNFSTGSTGSMSCFIPPAFDNNTYLAKIFKDEDYIGVKSYSTQPRAQDIFGDKAIFMGALGYVMLAFIGVSNPIASIVLGIIGLVFMSAMLILDGGSAFGIGSAFIWLFVAGGILIWKIYQRKA